MVGGGPVTTEPPAIAGVLFVPAVNWLARHDVGLVKGSLPGARSGTNPDGRNTRFKPKRDIKS